MNKYSGYTKLLIESSIISKKKLSDNYGSKYFEIKLVGGKTLNLVKLNSSESMGLPGWHNMDAAQHSYLGDTVEDAVAMYLKTGK